MNYTEHLFIIAFIFTGRALISVFGSLIDSPVGIASSAAAIKICVITAGIKKVKSISQWLRKEKKYIILLAKTKFNTV